VASLLLLASRVMLLSLLLRVLTAPGVPAAADVPTVAGILSPFLLAFLLLMMFPLF
jgi:hypothetical protein